MNNAKCKFNEDTDRHKHHGSAPVAKIKGIKSAHVIFFCMFLLQRALK